MAASRTPYAAGTRRAAALCGALIAVFAAQPAAADICSDLRAQLNAQAASGASSPFHARYAEAARRQAGEIRKVRQALSAADCFANPTARCQSLNRTLQKMTSNLDDLERTRDRVAPRGNTARVRAIENRLLSNGCGERQRVVRSEPQAGRSSNGRRVIVREGAGQARDDRGSFGSRHRIIVPQSAGTFRTMCVRTCDGYYFPVSFATGREFFGRDEQACRAMCPAAETRLYYHRVPDEESEAMVSLGGEPYTALPTAFRYRRQDQSAADPACTCGTPLSTANAPAGEDGFPAEPQPPAVPLPGVKPDGLADPETQMNTETGLTKQAVREMMDGVSQGDIHAGAAEREIRVVGPRFLPDPEEAIDLRSPARTPAR